MACALNEPIPDFDPAKAVNTRVKANDEWKHGVSIFIAHFQYYRPIMTVKIEHASFVINKDRRMDPDL